MKNCITAVLGGETIIARREPVYVRTLDWNGEDGSHYRHAWVVRDSAGNVVISGVSQNTGHSDSVRMPNRAAAIAELQRIGADVQASIRDLITFEGNRPIYNGDDSEQQQAIGRISYVTRDPKGHSKWAAVAVRFKDGSPRPTIVGRGSTRIDAVIDGIE